MGQIYSLLISDDQCTVSEEDIENFAASHGFTAWYKVSAKEGTNVEEAGDIIVKAILARENSSDRVVEKGMVLGTTKGSKKKCC